jgi:hypothetical protein
LILESALAADENGPRIRAAAAQGGHYRQTGHDVTRRASAGDRQTL